MIGKQVRMNRLFPTPTSKLFAVPLDHSLTMGPIAGMERLAPLAAKLQEGGAHALIVHKGAVRTISDILWPSTLLGIHLSASTVLSEEPHRKYRSGTVAEAVGLGADFVSVQVNFGVSGEGTMLEDMGEVAAEASDLGIPLLCMAYVKKKGMEYDTESLAHACRAAADLGADIVKTSFPSAEGFQAMVRGTPVPVLVGGGQKLDKKEDLMTLVRDSLRSGGRGICIGRNLFQHEDVMEICREVGHLLTGETDRPRVANP